MLHDFLRDGQIRSLSLRTPAGETRELTPGFVADVIENDRIRVFRKPKDELPSGARVRKSKFGLQFAKTIVNVGAVEANDQVASTPIGHDLEIVPLAEPELRATYVGFSSGKDVFAWTGEVSPT